MAGQQSYYTTRYTENQDDLSNALGAAFDALLPDENDEEAAPPSAASTTVKPELYFDPFKRRSTLASYTRSRRTRTWKQWDLAYNQPQPQEDYYRWYEPDRDPAVEARLQAAQRLLDARRQQENDSPPPPQVQRDGWFGWQIPPQVLYKASKQQPGRQYDDTQSSPTPAASGLPGHSDDEKVTEDVSITEEPIEDDSSLLVTGTSADPDSEWQAPDLHVRDEEEQIYKYRVCMAGAWLDQKYRDAAPAYQEDTHPWHLARSKYMNRWSVDRQIDLQEYTSGVELRELETDYGPHNVTVKIGKRTQQVVRNLDAGWEDSWKSRLPTHPSSTDMRRNRRTSSGDTLGTSYSSNGSPRARQWEAYNAYDSEFPSLHQVHYEGNDTSPATSPASRSSPSPTSPISPSRQTQEWSFSDLPNSPSSSFPHGRIANHSPVPSTRTDSPAAMPPQPAASNARQQQSSMLRQYSSIYVERARDPWLMQDSPEFRRQMMAASQGQPIQPSWFSGEEEVEPVHWVEAPFPSGAGSQPSASLVDGGQHVEEEGMALEEFNAYLAQPESPVAVIEEEGAQQDDEEAEIGGPWCEVCDEAFSTEEQYDQHCVDHPIHRQDHVHDHAHAPPVDVEPERQGSPSQSTRSLSPGPPPLERSTSPKSRFRTERGLPKPLADTTYCEKCRRHFGTRWKLQNHLVSSNFHPYYCRTCTVDFRSFGELHMHYAKDRFCRPPEMDSGVGKGFLQILVDHQATGRKQKQSAPRALDPQSASAAASTSSVSMPSPTRRWWHPPPPSPERTRSPVEELVPPPAVAASDACPPSAPNGLTEAGSATAKGKGKAPTSTVGTRRPIPKRRQDNPDLEPPSCPICINPLMEASEVVATACGHVYCAKCLLQGFSRCNNSCPKCRTPLSMTMIIPIYMKYQHNEAQYKQFPVSDRCSP